MIHSLEFTFYDKWFFFSLWRCGPTRAMSFSILRFLDHTQRRTIVSRTPLDEWSARRRDPYLTTHNTHNRQTSMPPVGFERTISASERLQTYALDRAATGTGKHSLYTTLIISLNNYNYQGHVLAFFLKSHLQADFVSRKEHLCYNNLNVC